MKSTSTSFSTFSSARLLLTCSAAFSLLLSGPQGSYAATAAYQGLAQQSSICTAQLGHSIRVQFKNDTSLELNANWIGTDCHEEIRERISVGWVVSIETQIGQVWVFRDAHSNQLIRTVTITDQTANTVVGMNDKNDKEALAPTPTPTVVLAAPTAAPTAIPEVIATAIPTAVPTAVPPAPVQPEPVAPAVDALPKQNVELRSTTASVAATDTTNTTNVIDDPQLISIKTIANPRTITSWGGSQVEANPRTITSWGGPNSDGYRKNQLAFASMGLDRAAALSGGEGITIAVLDTGFQLDHPMLANAFTAVRYDFVDRDMNPTDVKDGIDNDGNRLVDEAYGHGTHVSGIIRLIAPKAKIMPLRVLNADGDGNMANLVAAMLFAVQNGAKIINLSLGAAVDNVWLRAAVQYANANGVLVVAAAGNLDLWPKQYPAANSCAVAVTSAGQIANFFNQLTNNSANWIDFAAPGEKIYSTFPGSTYAIWSGSSMATPVVAANAALVWSRYPNATPRQVMQLINATSDVLKAGLSLLGLINLSQSTFQDVSKINQFNVTLNGSFVLPYIRRSPDVGTSLQNADTFFAGRYSSALSKGGALSDCL